MHEIMLREQFKGPDRLSKHQLAAWHHHRAAGAVLEVRDMAQHAVGQPNALQGRLDRSRIQRFKAEKWHSASILSHCG